MGRYAKSDRVELIRRELLYSPNREEWGFITSVAKKYGVSKQRVYIIAKRLGLSRRRYRKAPAETVQAVSLGRNPHERWSRVEKWLREGRAASAGRGRE